MKNTSKWNIQPNSPTYIYIETINNKSALNKGKDRYKVELKTLGTMEFFGSKENIIGNTKNKQNVPSLEVTEVSVQCSIAHNHCKKLFEYFLHIY